MTLPDMQQYEGRGLKNKYLKIRDFIPSIGNGY